MKFFKSSILLSLMVILVSFQSDEKIKADFKKGQILINKTPWSTYEHTGSKYFIKTMEGKEYLILTELEYGKGEYWDNGREKMHYYSEVKFATDGMDAFEVDLYKKDCIENIYKSNILVNDVFSPEAALEFKRKFEDKVSERRFKTK